MEVITIESEAFKRILNEIDVIKAALTQKDDKALASKWIHNDDVANLLKVSKRTLLNYRNEGKIAFSQIGEKVYYRATDIEEFLQNHHHAAFKRKPSNYI